MIYTGQLYQFSKISFDVFISFYRKYDYCLGNEASAANKYPYPGEHFSFEKQCDLEYNATYTAWKPTAKVCCSHL
jgi:hypothetical protein